MPVEDAVDEELKSYYESTLNPKKQTLQTELQLGEIKTDERSHVVDSPRFVNRNEKSTKQIAMDNCVEFEKAYSACLNNGPLTSRFSGCTTQKNDHEKCFQLQQLVLNALKFGAATSDAEKLVLKARADDLMLKYVPSLKITRDQEEAFLKAIDSLK